MNKKYIGIGNEVDDGWYCLSFLLYNRMLKLKLWTLRTRRPKFYWYDKAQFYYCLNSSNFIVFKWFFGIEINK